MECFINGAWSLIDNHMENKRVQELELEYGKRAALDSTVERL